jgi:hypothetical protein
MNASLSLIAILSLALAHASAFGQDPEAKPYTNLPQAPCQPVVRNACPSSNAAYIPLSTRGKFNLFLRSTYSPYTFASGAANATWAQMTGQWYQYGGGMQGWGKRLGATLADTEARRLIQGFALASALHQDPRYFPAAKKGLIPRGWYAATRVLVAKKDDGGATFNSAEILGALFTSSLENAYYPQHDRGFGETMSRFIGALGSDATSNVLREFWPDIKRIFRKHAPEKIKEIEDKLPSHL